MIAADKAELAPANHGSVDILASFEEVNAAQAMPDVPLIVVTGTVADPNEWPPGWDPALFDGLQAGLQADLVKLTSMGSQVFAEGAGHDNILDVTAYVVAKAIVDVLAAVTAR